MTDAAPGGELASGEITQFAAAAQLRNPRQFFRTGARSVRAALPIAHRLFARDLHARYRLSALGFAWIVVPAIAQTIVWLFLNESNILNSGPTDIPLPLFILVGTLLWQGFTDAINTPSTQLSTSTGMLSHVSFPAESLLLAGLADAAVNSVIRLVVSIPLLIYYKVTPTWTIVFAPVGLASILLLGFAIGLAIAPFGVLYQDLTRLLTIVTGFWLLVTPVAYTIPPGGPARILIKLNPVTPLLSNTRSWLTGGAVSPGGGLAMLAVILLSFVLLIVGWTIFRLSVPHLIDRIGT